MGLKKYVKMLDLGFMANPVIINGEVAYRSYYCSLVSIVALVFFLFYCVGKLFLASFDISIVDTKTVEISSDFTISELKLNLEIFLRDKATGKEIQIDE